MSFGWSELSRGEICVANIIPPENGASLSGYFCVKSHKLAVFEAKMSLQKQLVQPKLQTFSNGFWFQLDERSSFCLKCPKKISAHSVLPVPRSLGSKFVTDIRQTNSFTP